MTEFISIHAPREGSDVAVVLQDPLAGLFLSTLPARGATGRAGHHPAHRGDFYPRSPRGERLSFLTPQAWQLPISIHAPREGSDPLTLHRSRACSTFLSTLPARGATVPALLALGGIAISIHAPREGSDLDIFTPPQNASEISIHAPREGSDEPSNARGGGRTRRFLSTLPARGATASSPSFSNYIYISIHAPREGSDATSDKAAQAAAEFLSTLPARGATVQTGFCQHHDYISIHAPREGSDARVRSMFSTPSYFYPRSPRGERPAGRCPYLKAVPISIHAPREGSDSSSRVIVPCSLSFLSTLPARGATFPPARPAPGP